MTPFVERWQAKVDDLADDVAFQECVAIATVGGVTWAEALRMTTRERHAFDTVYNRQQQEVIREGERQAKMHGQGS